MREGLGTGRVQHRPALPGQLAEQGERDHALAAARAAGHDDDGLGVLLVGAVDGVQDQLVGQPLLREEHELLLVLDLGRGHLQQLTGRPYVAGQEPVRRARARRGREAVLQVVDERTPGRLREKPGPLVPHPVVEIRDVGLARRCADRRRRARRAGCPAARSRSRTGSRSSPWPGEPGAASGRRSCARRAPAPGRPRKARRGSTASARPPRTRHRRCGGPARPAPRPRAGWSAAAGIR